MVADDADLKEFTVHLPWGDYNTLKNEAKEKGTPFATYVRNILQAHLQKIEYSEQIRSEVASLLSSDTFDDVIVQKFLRAIEKRKN